MEQTIKQVMTVDHRHCDQHLASVANAIQQDNWNVAESEMSFFTQRLLAHFEFEEQTLFPAFENATGMIHGPTEMMRVEHDEVRGMLDSLFESLINREADNFYGLYETLNIYLQQHNMKEEGILYPLIDQECDNTDSLIEAMKNQSAHRAA